MHDSWMPEHSTDWLLGICICTLGWAPEWPSHPSNLSANPKFADQALCCF